MFRNMKLSLLTAILVLFASACAKHPDKMPGRYISPMTYKNYDCEQIQMEYGYVNTRANELYAQLKQKADRDSAQMAVGMVLFWPALLLLEGGDGPEAAEYSELKRKKKALEDVSVQKKCNLHVMILDSEKDKGKQNEESEVEPVE